MHSPALEMLSFFNDNISSFAGPREPHLAAERPELGECTGSARGAPGGGKQGRKASEQQGKRLVFWRKRAFCCFLVSRFMRTFQPLSSL